MPADNDFELFRLPAIYAIDVEELETRYLAMSEAVHPDALGGHDETSPRAGAAQSLLSERDAGGDIQTRRAEMLADSARLNGAYRTLRDPYTRAEYLLGLLGGAGPETDKSTPPDFLEEMLETRGEIETLLSEGDRHSELKARLPLLTARRDELLAEAGELLTRVQNLLANSDGESGRAAGALLSRVRQTLNAANYFRRMLQQIRDQSIPL